MLFMATPERHIKHTHISCGYCKRFTKNALTCKSDHYARHDHLFQDRYRARSDAGDPAPFPALRAHPRAFPAQSTSQQGYPVGCLTVKSKHAYHHNQHASNYASPHNSTLPMMGWFSGSTRRNDSSAFSPIASASACLPS